MRNIIAILIFGVSVIAAIYFGGWVLFVHPIITCCAAFDAGTLTAMMLGISILKCIVAAGVASILVYVGAIVATLVSK